MFLLVMCYSKACIREWLLIRRETVQRTLIVYGSMNALELSDCYGLAEALQSVSVPRMSYYRCGDCGTGVIARKVAWRMGIAPTIAARNPRTALIKTVRFRTERAGRSAGLVLGPKEAIVPFGDGRRGPFHEDSSPTCVEGK
jgi:hypothetical protein